MQIRRGLNARVGGMLLNMGRFIQTREISNGVIIMQYNQPRGVIGRCPTITGKALLVQQSGLSPRGGLQL